MGNKFRKANQLSKPELDFLMNNTPFDEQEIKEWYRGFKIDCPKGQLDKKNFIKVYKKFYPDGRPQTFCDHVFRVFDRDSNGHVDFKEFLISISIVSPKTSLKPKLEWIFKIYDIDGDGRIDRKEFKTIIESIYKLLDDKKSNIEDFQQQHLNEIFKRLDFEKHNSKISQEQFVESCTKDPILLKLLAPNI